MQASVTLADWRGPGLLAGLLSRIGHPLPAWRFDPHGERVSQRQGWRALGVLPAGHALLASFAFSPAGTHRFGVAPAARKPGKVETGIPFHGRFFGPV